MRREADDRDPLIGHLKAVADWAVADQTLRKCGVVVGLIHSRAAVRDPGGKQNRASRNDAAPNASMEYAITVLKLIDKAILNSNTELCRLLTHALKQHPA